MRERYAAAAEQAAGSGASCCGPAEGSCCGASAMADEERELFGGALYGENEREGLPEATRLASLGCIAGALTREQFEVGLETAGLVDVEVREIHRVHAKAGSAIVRARKPST